MTIMVVDPNTKNSSELTKLLQEMFPDSKVLTFCDPLLSLKFGANNPVDIVFAEAEMRRADGFTLFGTLWKFHPKIKTVITANDESYKEKTLTMGVGAYLCRPIVRKDVYEAVSILEVCQKCE